MNKLFIREVDKIMEKKVLIVDDSELWRQFLKFEIEQMGYNVEVAKDGIDGVNKFLSFLPDVVITDYVMPNMNGIHLTRFIRSYSQFKNVGIIILTSAEETINSFWAKESGANMFIKKSEDKEYIVNSIREFLEKKFFIEWSSEIYKIRKEPFRELVDILEESLRHEVIVSRIFEFIKYIDDERYLIYNLKEFLKEFFDVKSVHVLLLGISSGRIYSFSRDSEFFSKDKVKYSLLNLLKKPITPSNWNYYGMFSENGRGIENFEGFVLEVDGKEMGAIILEDVNNVFELRGIFTFALKPLGLIAQILNSFSDIKIQNELDELTKTYNKRFILSKLEELLKMSIRQKVPISIAMLDIDDFKKVNDTYGHVKGDEVLKEFARIINEEIRSSDYLGRYGGEEFLVLFPATTCDVAKKVLERVLDKVRVYDWKKLGVSQITFSGGIACDPEAKATFLEFIERADKNLYIAKRNGKNQIYGGE